jgi:serine/threonine-protein kinase
MDWQEFYKQLKRRHVFRVASIYVVAAWVAIQVAETTFPAFNLPNSLIQIIIILAISGFPVALLLAWVYDIVPDANDVQEDCQSNAEPGRKGRLVRRGAWIAVLVYSVLVVGFTKVYVTTSDDDNETLETSFTTPYKNSIAVLPFDNLANEAEGYFADGVADEIRSQLALVKSLKVISRTSCMFYKTKKLPLQEIASELKVGHILEGSVQKYGDNIKVNVSLSSAKSDEVVWSPPAFIGETGDIFNIQEEIARTITDALQIELSGDEEQYFSKRFTEDPEVYNLYLKAEAEYKKLSLDGMKRGVQIYKDVISIDPNFAPAYCALATASILEGMIWGTKSAQEARDSAVFYLNTARRIDDDFAKLHSTTGQLRFYLEWDFDKGEEELSLAGSMGYPFALVNLIDLYIKTGEYRKAAERLAQLEATDPLNAALPVSKSLVLYFTGEIDESIRLLEKAIRISPYYLQGQRVLGMIYTMQGEYEKAIEILEGAESLVGARIPFLTGYLAVSYFHSGNQDKAEELANILKTRWENQGGGDPAYYLALYYAGTGENDAAIDWLYRAHDSHEVELTWLYAEPAFESLRDDSGYLTLIDQIGFTSNREDPLLQ